MITTSQAIRLREVECGDAVAWLQASEEPFAGSVFTAVPDVKDVPAFNSMSDVKERAAAYTEWFNRIVEAVFRRLPKYQCAIFSQTDAKLIDIDGTVLSWIDKSHLCSTAAMKYDCKLLWHKIALNTSDEGETSSVCFRPSYTHLLCYGKEFTYHTAQFPTPDVLDRGIMTWQKATGIDSCILGVLFLRDVVDTPVIISPFCGHGTILATANVFGVCAWGMEIMPRRARTARNKCLMKLITSIPIEQLQKLGLKASHPTAAGNVFHPPPPTGTVYSKFSGSATLNAKVDNVNDGDGDGDDDDYEESNALGAMEVDMHERAAV